MIKQILKNLSSLTFAKILAQVFAFFTTVYLSRILGVEKYGVIGYVTAIIVYLNMFGNLGLETYAIREVARHPKRLSFFISHTLSLRLISSIFVFLLAALISYFLKDARLISTLLMLYAFNIFILGFSLNWTFAALHRMEFYGLTQIIIQFIYMVLIFWFIKKPQDIYYVPLAFIIGNLTGILFTWGKHFRLIKNISLRFNPGLWKKMLKISLPIIVSYIILRINLNFSILYFGTVGKQTEVGLFNAAFKIIFLLLTVREVLISVAYPLMSKYFVESKEKLAQVMQGFIKLALLFTLPVVLGGSLLAEDIIRFIFGEHFINAALPLRILLVAFLFMMINIVFPSSQNAFNKEKKYLKISMINSGSNVLLNILLIPVWGLVGAAAASALTEMISLALFKWESNKTVAVGFFAIFVKILLPSLLMLLALYFLPEWNVLLRILLGALIYLTAVLLFKVVTPAEISMLKAGFSKQE